jgi:CRISPR/Cas system-associated exonuclease Cas4 (RecB family)
LFHEVQLELHREAARDGLLPFIHERADAVLARADQVLDRVAKKYEEELAPAIPKVWARSVEELRIDLRGWIRWVIDNDRGWRPLHAELAFGLERDPGRDPASVLEPVLVLDGILLRGAIDLVEEQIEGGALRVTDHKTGRAPFWPVLRVARGEHLQPLLYALAAERMLGRDVITGRLFYCTQRGGYERVDVEISPEGKRTIERVFAIIDRSIEEGFLPAAPDPRRHPCRFCDFLPVCGTNEELRTSRKPADALGLLNELRAMR